MQCIVRKSSEISSLQLPLTAQIVNQHPSHCLVSNVDLVNVSNRRHSLEMHFHLGSHPLIIVDNASMSSSTMETARIMLLQYWWHMECAIDIDVAKKGKVSS